MHKLVKPVAIGAAAGALLGALIAAAGAMAGASADEAPLVRLVEATSDLLFQQAEPSQLLKIGDDTISARVAPWVSLTPTATSTVRKIGYGTSRFVAISTTSTGVYSSDALRSPYVRYPGIEAFGARGPVAAREDSLVAWSSHGGWRFTPSVSAGSFATITRQGDIQVLVTPSVTCVIGPTIAFC